MVALIACGFGCGGVTCILHLRAAPDNLSPEMVPLPRRAREVKPAEQRHDDDLSYRDRLAYPSTSLALGY